MTLDFIENHRQKYFLYCTWLNR